MRTLLFFLLFFIPFFTFASCDSQGKTILYVNGVLTSEDDADKDSFLLRKTLEGSNIKNTFVINGYNPSHLAGFGDWIKSVQQAYVGKNEVPIDDYDLKNILLQISSKVTTKKFLLLGHSQGTF